MSFLELPVSIRQIIYADAGLSRPCAIDFIRKIKHEPTRPKFCHQACRSRRLPCNHLATKGPCRCPSFPVHILRVCRQVYNEALAVLYGSNDFMIICQSPQDLEYVGQLPSSALKNVQSLTIRLTSWSCARGHDNRLGVCHHCESCKPSFESLGGISFRDGRGTDMAWRWTDASTYLAESLQPNRVRLSLVADCMGEKEACLIVDNLRNLPTLKQLDLRLGRLEYAPKELSNLAQKTVEDMTRHRPSGVFPYENLPAELRLRILEFTGLTGYSDCGQCKIRINITGTKVCLPRLTHECCEHCCSKSYGCFCRFRYAAASSRCLSTIPSSLFYVNKAMNECATRVLFTQGAVVFGKGLVLAALSIVYLWYIGSPLLPLFRDVTIRQNDIHWLWPEENLSQTRESSLQLLAVLINLTMNKSALSLTFELPAVIHEDSYNEHCRMVQHLRPLQGVRKMTIRTGHPEWNNELVRQFHGGDALPWAALNGTQNASTA